MFGIIRNVKKSQWKDEYDKSVKSYLIDKKIVNKSINNK